MIDRYITYLRDVRRYSPRTQTLYRQALETFARWAEAGEDENGLLAQLIPSRIREYEGHLIEEGLKPRTVHLHMSALSGLCNFLLKSGVIQSNPVRTVRRPKMEKRLPEYFTERSLEAYLEETRADAGQDTLDLLLQLGPGDRTAVELYRRRLRRLIIALLYGTGIRRAELIALQVGSVDPSRNTLRVRGKGDKMREIPLIISLS